MHKGWFVLRLIGSLVLLGVLVVGGIALFNAGWSQGYMTASLAAAPSAAAPAPVMPYGYYTHPMFFHGFLGFGLLIPLLLLGLAFLVGLRMLFFRPIMMWHGGFPSHHFGPHGPMGGRFDPQEMEKWRQEWQKWHEQSPAAGEKTESPDKKVE
jgi:hypothetical protein